MKSVLLKKISDPFTRLLWKMQISIFRACPPLCGIIAKTTFHAYQNRKVYMKGLLPVAVQIPRALRFYLRDKWEHRVVLPRVCIGTTLRCTLNCDKCLAHIPDLKNQRDEPIDDLVRDIRALLACVDFIYVITLSGGECFLHPDLDQIIRVCADSSKVGHIEVVTSGTILPNSKVLAALREAEATVKISKYPAALASKAEPLKAVLDANGIHNIYEIGMSWIDIGGFGQLKEGSPAWRFKNCLLRLEYTYYRGTLHLCCESVSLMYDGRIPDCKEEYINLRSISPAAFQEQLKALLKRSAITACSYCLGHTYKTPKVPVAVQRVSMEPMNLHKEPSK